MGFASAVKSCFSKYATFSGRACRSEYWWWVLFTLIFSFIPIVNIITGILFLLPGLAVIVRRLHDTGHSGWWWFINLIPIIGWIWMFVLLVTDSQPGENAYGPNPKEA